NNSDLPQGREFGWLFAQSGQRFAEPFRAAITAGNASLYLEAPQASDADHATVQGEVLFWDDGDGPGELAALKLTLVRDLGAFKTQPYERGARPPRPAS